MLGRGGKLLRFLNFALDEGEWLGFTLRPLYFRVENLGGCWLGGLGVALNPTLPHISGRLFADLFQFHHLICEL